jgi:hypothetical protein
MATRTLILKQDPAAFDAGVLGQGGSGSQAKSAKDKEQYCSGHYLVLLELNCGAAVRGPDGTLFAPSVKGGESPAYHTARGNFLTKKPAWPGFEAARILSAAQKLPASLLLTLAEALQIG